MSRAVFLDRDGTLNAEVGFVRHPSELKILPGVPAALRRLRAAGFRLVVVTNQSGVARGLYSEAELAEVHAALHRNLEELPAAYLHCPHLPDGGHGYGGPCACRKPGAGLLHQARELLGVAFEGSALIGDSARDLLMAKGLPIRTVHVGTGKPVAGQLEELRAAGFQPDHHADDLGGAADWLLAQR